MFIILINLYNLSIIHKIFVVNGPITTSMIVLHQKYIYIYLLSYNIYRDCLNDGIDDEIINIT